MFKLVIVALAALFAIAMAEPEAKAKPVYYGSALINPYAYSGYNHGYYPYSSGYYGGHLGGYYGGLLGRSYGNSYYGNGLYGNRYLGHYGIY